MKTTDYSIISEIDANYEKSSQLNDFFALYFHEKSKYDKYSFLQERQRIAFFALPQMVKREVMPYKCYPNTELIPLNGYIAAIARRGYATRRIATARYACGILATLSSLAPARE